MLLHSHDNLYAMLNDREPIFGIPCESQSRPIVPSSDSALTFDGSPLWMPNASSDDLSVQVNQLECILGDRETAECLTEAAKVTRFTHDEFVLSMQSQQQNTGDRLRHYTELCSRLYMAASNQCDEAEACRLALRIYLGSIMQLTPFADASNRTNTDLLFSVVARLNPTSWEKVPFVYQWM